MKKKFDSGVLIGIALVILAVILLLNTMGITNINLFFKGWWTLLIIIPSLVELIRSEDKTVHAIFLFIGVFSLLASYGVVSYASFFSLLVPLLILFVGLSLIFRPLIYKEEYKEFKELKIKGEEMGAVFSEEFIKNEKKFKMASLNAVFGTLNYDISKAEIEKNAAINASAIFGAINIKVPKNVKVKVYPTTILGSIRNNVKEDDEEKDIIRIRAMSLFGGIKIND